MRSATGFAIAIVVTLAGTARADGYCAYVEGVAAAESALMFAPELFGQVGYVPAPVSTFDPDARTDGFRLVSGVRYRLSGIPEGLAVRRRANADCRRHQASDLVGRETRRRALVARGEVIEAALRELASTLDQVDAAVAAHRTTAQAATATRLRLEELRQLAEQTRSSLAELPASNPANLGGAVGAFLRADEALEASEATLRRVRAFELDVRGGVDAIPRSAGEPARYFGFVTASINLGVLFQGRANARAAAGRRALAHGGSDPISIERTTAMIDAETRRLTELDTLGSELARQLAAIDRVGSDDVESVRELVWFELVKVRADHAYHAAYLGALRETLGASR